jgi:DNA-binding GntR family transcriptional regulator
MGAELHIDHDAMEPAYRQIAAWIVAQIETGELQPGRRIPSETTIQQMTGCARTTTRRAVRWLRDEGYVATVPGRGTFVAPESRGPA